MRTDIELIKDLEIEYNIELKQVEEGVDRGLSDLEYQLDSNNNVVELSLKNIELTSMFGRIGRFIHLTKLFLSNNQLTTFPKEIAGLKNLQELDLSSNQLTTFPKEIAGLKNLQELDLSSNQLTTLPMEIAGLKNLKELSLCSNQLTTLPMEIAGLKNLKELYLFDNQLTTLPKEIAGLKNLKELYLFENQLTTLPKEIAGLKNLKGLYLFENQLTTLPREIAGLKNLKGLYLSNNQLTTFPKEIAGLKNLQELAFSNNQLTTFPKEIAGLKNLRELDFSNNQLTTLPKEIAGLKNLQELYFNNNQLTTLPKEIASLKNLKGLYLSNNQLRSLPKEITEIKLKIKLDEDYSHGIFLKYNPLIDPPIEIVKQGKDAVVEYFEAIEKGEIKSINEVKVLFVGDGRVGKTSLIKRILKNEYDKEERQTHGININRWDVSIKNRDIRANIWDFGGQQIMHATHQFFLSKRSLYILVLDGRKEESPDYWLKHVESLSGDSSIMVVLNKIDENPGFELNRLDLKRKYKGIIDFYRISCDTEEGIEEFKNHLVSNLGELKHVAYKWPLSWFNVKTELEEMKDDFISYNQYMDICEKYKINEEETQDTLVNWLHDLGIVLHFREYELLDTQVLEPRWVTVGVYRILNSRILADKKGILKIEYLKEILKKTDEIKFNYPPAKYKYLIDLMKKFELCYEMKTSIVLIPDLLAVEEPEIEFDYDSALRFNIEYDFLPKSIMPRFIVKMNKDIVGELRWRTGVVLKDEGFNSTAVIRSDNDARKIYIFVNGDQKREYLAIILFALRDIKRSFEKLSTEERIPMPDNPRVTVSYKHLLMLEKGGEEYYIPEGAERKYNVKDLLGTIHLERKTEEEMMEILKRIEIIVSAKDKETALNKLKESIILQPNIFGVGVDVKKIIEFIDNLFKKPTKSSKKPTKKKTGKKGKVFGSPLRSI